MVYIRVGIPHVDGHTYTAETLKHIAEKDPEHFTLDDEGNLMRYFTDEETDTLDAMFSGTPAEGMAGDVALENFQKVLKHREGK